MTGMSDLENKLERLNSKREADAKKYREHDGDLCMLCHAYGDDKRPLHIDCFYDIAEAVPEALDLANVGRAQGEKPKRSDYYLKICKTCRAGLLNHLRTWRNESVARRDIIKTHDGAELFDDEIDSERNIPVRIDGAVVMLTQEEWDKRIYRVEP